MIYDLAETGELQAAADMLAEFGAVGKKIELKVYRQKRSNPQNRALHLLLGLMSQETGYTVDECKDLYKQINKSIYSYMKPTMDNQDVNIFMRSSADLNTEEMAKSIDNLYRVLGEQGISLPLLTNEAEMLSLERELEKNSNY